MISVIIPIYNAEKSIEKSLISIKNQTWNGDFEILIVNDGSTDKSAEIIQNYQQNNPDQNITLIHQENGGVSKARNTAMKIAKGEFIALLDADDEWLPMKIERQMNVLSVSDGTVDFLSSLRLKQKLKYPYYFDSSNLAEINFRKLLLRNEAQPSTVVFRRKILDNTGCFDQNQRYGEDINYWLKISLNNNMYILGEELVIAGGGKRSFGVSGLSSNLGEMERGFGKNIKELFTQGHLSLSEYYGYYFFYKLKYVFRIVRSNVLKLTER